MDNLNKKEVMSRYIKTKYYSFEDFLADRSVPGIKGQISHMYFGIYERVYKKQQPTILELGTHKGVSTLMFLQACLENGGHLYSVDIADYSDLTDLSFWTFIQSDSTDVNGILKKHPTLGKGIDVLLIDSLHKRSHVEKEFWGWAPYLNKNALIIFDDVDPNIYRPGNRKDNVFHEFDWEDIRRFVEEVFYANEDTLFLEFHYGSTGFAIMTKRSEKSVSLCKHRPIQSRTQNVFWKNYIKIRQILGLIKRAGH